VSIAIKLFLMTAAFDVKFGRIKGNFVLCVSPQILLGPLNQGGRSEQSMLHVWECKGFFGWKPCIIGRNGRVGHTCEYDFEKFLKSEKWDSRTRFVCLLKGKI
jgi:hypothetical protein